MAWTGKISGVINPKEVLTLVTTSIIKIGRSEVLGKGYCSGGYTGSVVNVIEDLRFSSETSDPISATLSTNRYSCTGMNSIDKGFTVSGINSSYTMFGAIEALTFRGESNSSISATLTTARGDATSVSIESKGM